MVASCLAALRHHEGEVGLFPAGEAGGHVGDVGVAHGLQCLPCQGRSCGAPSMGYDARVPCLGPVLPNVPRCVLAIAALRLLYVPAPTRPARARLARLIASPALRLSCTSCAETDGTVACAISVILRPTFSMHPSPYGMTPHYISRRLVPRAHHASRQGLSIVAYGDCCIWHG